MGSTLDIPVPATSQLIGTDCIPTAIIRRRHQKFHTDAKRVRFHIRGLIPGHNATVLRLYSDDKESFWLYSDSNYARTVFRLQLSDFEYSRNTVPKLDRSGLLRDSFLHVTHMSRHVHIYHSLSQWAEHVLSSQSHPWVHRTSRWLAPLSLPS